MASEQAIPSEDNRVQLRDMFQKIHSMTNYATFPGSALEEVLQIRIFAAMNFDKLYKELESEKPNKQESKVLEVVNP